VCYHLRDRGLGLTSSIAFADPPPLASDPITSNGTSAATQEDEPVVPLENPPKTLMEWAVLILNTPHPRLKVERTKHAVHLFRTGKLKSIGHKAPNAPRPPDVPSRDDVYLKNTVDPSKVKNRRNRASMLHALANIEQWAIDLACVPSLFASSTTDPLIAGTSWHALGL